MPESEPKPKLIELTAAGEGQGWKAVLSNGKAVVVQEIALPGPEAAAAVPRIQRLAEHRHPALAPVLAWGTEPNGIWVATEPNEGVPLSTILNRGPLTPAAAAALGAALLSGIAALHEAGISMGGFGASSVRVTSNGEVRIAGHPASVVRGAPSQSDLRADVRSCGMAICAAFGVDPAGAPAPPTIPPGLVVTMRSMASGAMGPAADRAQGALREMASALLAPDRMIAAQSELALRSGGREMPVATFLPEPEPPRPAREATPLPAPASYDAPARPVETYTAPAVPATPPPPAIAPQAPAPAPFEPLPPAPEAWPSPDAAPTPPYEPPPPAPPTWESAPPPTVAYEPPRPATIPPVPLPLPEPPPAPPAPPAPAYEAPPPPVPPSPFAPSPPPMAPFPPARAPSWTEMPSSLPETGPAPAKTPTWAAVPSPEWTPGRAPEVVPTPAPTPNPTFTPAPTASRPPISAASYTPTPARRTTATPPRRVERPPSDRPAWLVPAAMAVIVLLLLGAGGIYVLAHRGSSTNPPVASKSPAPGHTPSPKPPSPVPTTGPKAVPVYAPASAGSVTSVQICTQANPCSIFGSSPDSDTRCDLNAVCNVDVAIYYTSSESQVTDSFKFFDRCTGVETDLAGGKDPTQPSWKTGIITTLGVRLPAAKSAALVALSQAPAVAASAPLMLGAATC